MAFLVTTIIVEVSDDLVRPFPAAQENLTHFTEEAIRNRLFGKGFMPDDVEIDSWVISSKWITLDKVSDPASRSLVLTSFEAETLKQINNDHLDYMTGSGEMSDAEDEALVRIIAKIKEL